jgi:hypothetical protein
MTTFDQANQFLKAGIAIIPITYRDKRPRFDQLPAIDGHPSWEPYKAQLPSDQDLHRWLAGTANYGIVCGWNGLTVLDFDAIDEYTTWLLWATRTGGIANYVARNAYRVSTSRGVHVYIRLPHKEKNRKAGKIDIKGDGYVLGPGSIHPSGTVYRAMRDVLNFPVVDALSDVLPAALLAPILGKGQPTPATWTKQAPVGQSGSGLVKKIKSQFAIESFFPQARKSGPGWLLTTCPLHDDHKPSFWVSQKQQICGCFKPGCTPLPLDVIDLYGRLHGLNIRDAIFALAAGG